MYNEKVLNSVQTWFPGFSAMCHYTKFGMASAAAGQQGNIAAFSINQVYGTSLYIRNLQAFKGGKNSYSVKVETAQDRQTALDSARAILITQEAEMKEFLAYPCKEFAQEKNGRLRLSWACQFVTYAVPSYMHVTAVRLERFFS